MIRRFGRLFYTRGFYALGVGYWAWAAAERGNGLAWFMLGFLVAVTGDRLIDWWMLDRHLRKSGQQATGKSS